MQRIDFNIYDELAMQVDNVIKKFGFRSRAEFFRYAAIDFIRREDERVPADKILKEHTHALRAIKSGQGKEFY
jgi:metal-responsive CopG/Arc/MetJ family transcriptional regulator